MTKEFKETEEAISLHGLGFLQVKLQGKQRLHVWHPDLPRRRCFMDSAIHDHRFGFTSLVLVGTQINHDYAMHEVRALMVPTHILYKHEGERSQFGNRPWTPDGGAVMVHAGSRATQASDRYDMRAFCYHSTEPGGNGKVATILHKRDESASRGAHSTCRVGVQPDVDFDRKQMSESDMWSVVQDVLGRWA